MTAEFSKSVDIGLKLSKRIYYGKEGPSMSAPKPATMTKSPSSSPCPSPLPAKHHPTAPMVYAMITDPEIVDNPDIQSYQPHVYGRCNPPALIPLQMHEISMNTDCYLDTAFVTVTGTWRVHCVTATKSCDCRIAIPMGEQGSILDINVQSTKRSYFTKLVADGGDEKDSDRITKEKDGFLMKRNTYTLKIPQVDGGSIIQVKVRWSQKLLYQDGEFQLSIPFTFPPYVFPLENKIPKTEKMVLNVNNGPGTLITCSFTSHHFKVQRQPGEASFVYESEVHKWSTQDLYFSYSVCSNDIFGGLLLQRPSLRDYDQRDMFCFYLFPGTNTISKQFRKKVVFLLDISGSMRGVPVEKSTHAIITSLSKLNQQDFFNIIAFNEGIQSFSSSMELATEEAIRNATEWMWKRLVAEGGTNFMCPLKEAIDMVGINGEFIRLIFLITDGTVEDERDICNNMMKYCHVDGSLSSPRICTFGIGSYCNNHFLRMLAHIGRGYHDHAHDVDLIGVRVQRLFNNALSPLLANVTLDALENLKSYELYPSRIPDLLFGRPLIISGRYQGKFPEFVKIRGLLADQSSFLMDIKVKNSKNINLDKVCGEREMDILTSQAWLDQNTHLVDKVAGMSLQRGIPSEYTRIILVQKDKVKPTTLQALLLDDKCLKLANEKMICVRNPCIGFGNLKATAENIPPGMEDVKLNEAVQMVVEAATSCWGMFTNSWAWSQLKNEHCALVIAQLCAALACLEFLDCCCDLCESCIDMCPRR